MADIVDNAPTDVAPENDVADQGVDVQAAAPESDDLPSSQDLFAILDQIEAEKNSNSIDTSVETAPADKAVENVTPEVPVPEAPQAEPEWLGPMQQLMQQNQALMEEIKSLRTTSEPEAPKAPVDPLTQAAQTALGEYASERSINEYKQLLQQSAAYRAYEGTDQWADLKPRVDQIAARMDAIRERTSGESGLRKEIAELRAAMDDLRSQPQREKETAARTGALKEYLGSSADLNDFPGLDKIRSAGRIDEAVGFIMSQIDPNASDEDFRVGVERGLVTLGRMAKMLSTPENNTETKPAPTNTQAVDNRPPQFSSQDRDLNTIPEDDDKLLSSFEWEKRLMKGLSQIPVQ